MKATMMELMEQNRRLREGEEEEPSERMSEKVEDGASKMDNSKLHSQEGPSSETGKPLTLPLPRRTAGLAAAGRGAEEARNAPDGSAAGEKTEGRVEQGLDKFARGRVEAKAGGEKLTQEQLERETAMLKKVINRLVERNRKGLNRMTKQELEAALKKEQERELAEGKSSGVEKKSPEGRKKSKSPDKNGTAKKELSSSDEENRRGRSPQLKTRNTSPASKNRRTGIRSPRSPQSAHDQDQHQHSSDPRRRRSSLDDELATAPTGADPDDYDLSDGRFQWRGGRAPARWGCTEDDVFWLAPSAGLDLWRGAYWMDDEKELSEAVYLFNDSRLDAECYLLPLKDPSRGLGCEDLQGDTRVRISAVEVTVELSTREKKQKDKRRALLGRAIAKQSAKDKDIQSRDTQRGVSSVADSRYAREFPSSRLGKMVVSNPGGAAGLEKGSTNSDAGGPPKGGPASERGGTSESSEFVMTEQSSTLAAPIPRTVFSPSSDPPSSDPWNKDRAPHYPDQLLKGSRTASHEVAPLRGPPRFTGGLTAFERTMSRTSSGGQGMGKGRGGQAQALLPRKASAPDISNVAAIRESMMIRRSPSQQDMQDSPRSSNMRSARSVGAHHRLFMSNSKGNVLSGSVSTSPGAGAGGLNTPGGTVGGTPAGVPMSSRSSVDGTNPAPPMLTSKSLGGFVKGASATSASSLETPASRWSIPTNKFFQHHDQGGLLLWAGKDCWIKV